MRLIKSFALIVLLAGLSRGYIVNQNVERTIDLTSQLVKESIKIEFQDTSGNGVTEYIFVVPPGKRPNLAFIAAKDSSNTELKVKEDNKADSGSFKILLRSSSKAQVIWIETVFTKDITPHPMEIKQSEKQLVKYNGNLNLYSPYKTKTQKTSVKLSSSNVLSYTQTKPVSLASNKIKYGPFENIEEFDDQILSIHFENESPFLTVKNLERVIEVSHWGNIAVKESIDMEHSGAKLKGSFSRYDFQRDTRSGYSAVKSYKSILPASAADVYYRDSNGNISTSNMNTLHDYVELELRPRFPLFGGWKTQYILGYNVPSFEYLFNFNDHQFMLKMRLVDHIYDDMVIDEGLIKVILPEGSTNIKLITPYPVTRNADDLIFTYLDIIGRPVISFSKKNMVENHMLDFSLKYSFSTLSLLQEPLLVTAFIFLIFVFAIVLLRLDFSITVHNHKE